MALNEMEDEAESIGICLWRIQANLYGYESTAGMQSTLTTSAFILIQFPLPIQLCVVRVSIHQRIGLIVCLPNAVLIILGMFMQVKYYAQYGQFVPMDFNGKSNVPLRRK